MNVLMRLLREPLLHFLIIGGSIFLLYAAVEGGRERPADVIVIGPERISQLAAGYNAVWTRMPTDDELKSLIEEDIREEVYYRDALALGLDRNDTIVRRRLRQKMEFLTDTGAYLQEPPAKDLETYFAANEQKYRRDARIAFEHIFFGENPNPETISQALIALQSDPPADPSTLGTRTLLPPQLRLSVQSAVDGVFGQGFFEQIAKLAPGVWSGPVVSSYGAHLVRTLDGQPGRVPPLSEVRDAVLRDWRTATALEIREKDYARRLERYIVEIHRGDESNGDNR